MRVDQRLASLLEGFNNPSLPGIDLSLERVEKLLAALGDPQKRLPSTIHVAGTNGKGSTIAFMRAMLDAAGKRVHVYTSPHLVRFNERIVLAGEEIGDDALINVLERVKQGAANIDVTFFEATTVAAFLAFTESKADYLLLEVGMGGRLDATNLITPIASVITPIALDHAEFLGNDIASIAREKAGIIKSGVPVISAMQEPAALRVIEETAVRHGAPLVMAGPSVTLPVGLEGEHQHANAALAVAAIKTVTDIPDATIAQGLKQARWPARLQKLTKGPLAPCWLDGGHNAHAAEALSHWITGQKQPVALVLGMMARKDPASYLSWFKGKLVAVIAVPVAGAQDAMDPAIIAKTAKDMGFTAHKTESLAEAAQALDRYKPATVLVCGSLYLAGEVLKTHE